MPTEFDDVPDSPTSTKDPFDDVPDAPAQPKYTVADIGRRIGADIADAKFTTRNGAAMVPYEGDRPTLTGRTAPAGIMPPGPSRNDVDKFINQHVPLGDLKDAWAQQHPDEPFDEGELRRSIHKAHVEKLISAEMSRPVSYGEQLKREAIGAWMPGMNAITNEEYRTAKERLDKGEATRGDLRSIGQYEQIEQAKAQRGTLQNLAGAAATVPGMIGRMANPFGVAEMTLEGTAQGASQRALEQGGTPLSPENLIPSAIQNYAMAKISKVAPGVGMGLTNPLAKVAAGALKGTAEMQGLASAEAIADKFLPERYQFKGGGGAAGSLARGLAANDSALANGNYGKAGEQLLKDLVVMGGLSASHAFAGVHTGGPVDWLNPEMQKYAEQAMKNKPDGTEFERVQEAYRLKNEAEKPATPNQPTVNRLAKNLLTVNQPGEANVTGPDAAQMRAGELTRPGLGQGETALPPGQPLAEGKLAEPPVQPGADVRLDPQGRIVADQSFRAAQEARRASGNVPDSPDTSPEANARLLEQMLQSNKGWSSNEGVSNTQRRETLGENGGGGNTSAGLRPSGGLAGGMDRSGNGVRGQGDAAPSNEGIVKAKDRQSHKAAVIQFSKDAPVGTVITDAGLGMEWRLESKNTNGTSGTETHQWTGYDSDTGKPINKSVFGVQVKRDGTSSIIGNVPEALSKPGTVSTPNRTEAPPPRPPQSPAEERSAALERPGGAKTAVPEPAKAEPKTPPEPVKTEADKDRLMQAAKFYGVTEKDYGKDLSKLERIIRSKPFGNETLDRLGKDAGPEVIRPEPGRNTFEPLPPDEAGGASPAVIPPKKPAGPQRRGDEVTISPPRKVGENLNRHAILDSAGKDVGGVSVRVNGPRLEVMSAASDSTLGTGAWRGLLRSLGEAYPNATEAKFTRTTGPNAGKEQVVKIGKSARGQGEHKFDAATPEGLSSGIAELMGKMAPGLKKSEAPKAEEATPAPKVADTPEARQAHLQKLRSRVADLVGQDPKAVDPKRIENAVNAAKITSAAEWDAIRQSDPKRDFGLSGNRYARALADEAGRVQAEAKAAEPKQSVVVPSELKTSVKRGDVSYAGDNSAKGIIEQARAAGHDVAELQVNAKYIKEQHDSIAGVANEQRDRIRDAMPDKNVLLSAHLNQEQDQMKGADEAAQWFADRGFSGPQSSDDVVAALKNDKKRPPMTKAESLKQALNLMEENRAKQEALRSGESESAIAETLSRAEEDFNRESGREPGVEAEEPSVGTASPARGADDVPFRTEQPPSDGLREWAQATKKRGWDRLKRLGSGERPTSGADVGEIATALTEIVAGELVNGAYSFADFARDAVELYGEKIKPHLESIYQKATGMIPKEPTGGTHPVDALAFTNYREALTKKGHQPVGTIGVILDGNETAAAKELIKNAGDTPVFVSDDMPSDVPARLLHDKRTGQSFVQLNRSRPLNPTELAWALAHEGAHAARGKLGRELGGDQSTPYERSADRLAEAVSGRRTGDVAKPPESTTGPQPPAGGPTSIQNEQTNRERAKANLPAFGTVDPVGHSFPELRDKVARIASENPTKIDDLVAELKSKPRPVTDLEDAQLLWRENEVRKEYKKAATDLIEARNGDAFDLIDAKKNEESVRSKLREITDITKKVGTETARGLAARQMFVNEDFSLAAMIVRAEVAKGRPLTDKEVQGITEKQKVIEQGKEKSDLLQKQVEEEGQGHTSKSYGDWQKALVEVSRRRNEFESGLAADRANLNPVRKAEDWVVKLRRAMVISSPKTMAKILAASAEQVVARPLDEMAGSAWRHVPGIAKIAKGALTEGRGFQPGIEAKSFVSTFSKGFADAWDTIKHGGSALDSLHANNNVPRSWLDVVGELHAAGKAPAVRNAYTRSFLKRIDGLAKQGVDVTNPLQLLKISGDAYRDSLSAKFQQDNRVVDAVNAAISTLRAKDSSIYARAAGLAADIIMPVRRIPANIVAEAFQRAFGTVTGLTRAATVLARGVEESNPAQREAVMQSLKRGSIGGAAMALGFAAPAIIGGLRRRDEQKGGEVEAGTIKTPWGPIPNAALHHPLFEAMMMGATVSKAAHEVVKKTGQEKGYLSGTTDALTSLVSETPLIGTAGDIAKATNPREQGHYFGELAKSLVVPQFVSWLAGHLDTGGKGFFGEPVKRKTVTVPEAIKSGVPLLRNQLPAK